jgi:hypothetical protein
MSKNSSSASTRISTYLMMIVLIVLALSIVALLLSVSAFTSGNELLATFLLLIGFIAMGLSVYVLLQSRRRVASMKIEAESATLRTSGNSSAVISYSRSLNLAKSATTK